MTTSGCQRCSELLAGYHDAIAVLVESGKRLTAATGSREFDFYKRVLEEYQRAFLRCKDLRKLLMVHLKSHGTTPSYEQLSLEVSLMPYKRLNVATDTAARVESFNRTGIDFVFTELDVAITFCRESLLARDPSRAVRAVGNARRAFRVALKKRKEFVFNEVEKRDLVERVSQLKTLLREVARRKLPHTP